MNDKSWHITCSVYVQLMMLQLIADDITNTLCNATIVMCMWKLISNLLEFIHGHIHDQFLKKQGKSEGFDSCDRPSNLTQIGFKSSIFRPCDLEIWWMTQKIIRHVFYTTSSFNLCIISDPSGNSNWRYSPETANLSQNRRFFLAVWPSNLTYDLEKQ